MMLQSALRRAPLLAKSSIKPSGAPTFVFNNARFFSAESLKTDTNIVSKMSIKDLPVSESLKNALETSFKFSDLTLVQEKAIPAVLDPNDTRDVIVQSKTGSGKTLAFLIPLVETILKKKKSGSPVISGLVITPTRELAIQIESVLRKLLASLRANIHQDILIGGMNVAQEEKKLVKWLRGIGTPDIIVATPGRLLMHLDGMPEFQLLFNNLNHFVLDEADTLIDIGFMEDIQKIARFLPKERKTMFFSATMKRKANELALDVLKKDRLYITNDESAAIPSLKQRVWLIDGDNRWANYIRLIMDNPSKKMIFFFETKKAVDLFARFLNHYDIRNIALHGGKDQKARTNLFFQFSQDTRAKVLICTDVAARGLDFPDVDIVVQADLPVGSSDFANYFHRSGRTARAGKKGIALLPLTTQESEYVLPVLKQFLNAHYKEEVKMIPIDKDDGLVLDGDVKSIQATMEELSSKDLDIRLEARSVARMFDQISTRFQSLYLRGVRVYTADAVLRNMQASVNKSLGVETSFSGSLGGGLGMGMQREENRFTKSRPAYRRDDSYNERRNTYGRPDRSFGGYAKSSYRERDSSPSRSFGDRSSEESSRPRSFGGRTFTDRRVTRDEDDSRRFQKSRPTYDFKFDDDENSDFMNIRSRR
jgi:ATP-dependent RNA helicase DDX18/HAS1